jgi:hypothetical protein
MELSQLFTFLVVGIGATHLVWMASTQITAWRDVRKNSRSRGTAIKEKPIRQRNDWYVFFSCSALVGLDQIGKGNASIKENRQQLSEKNHKSQSRPRAQL